MAKYIPKVDDVVFVDCKEFVRCLVVAVAPAKHTADVKTVSGVIVVLDYQRFVEFP